MRGWGGNSEEGSELLFFVPVDSNKHWQVSLEGSEIANQFAPMPVIVGVFRLHSRDATIGERTPRPGRSGF